MQDQCPVTEPGDLHCSVYRLIRFLGPPGPQGNFGPRSAGPFTKFSAASVVIEVSSKQMAAGRDGGERILYLTGNVNGVDTAPLRKITTADLHRRAGTLVVSC